MKKGFTLIELLAVILILGIIALIAIPQVTNVIENASKGAAETSAEHYIGAVNNKIALVKLDADSLNDIKDGTKNITDIPVDMQGELPESGTVTINNGVVISASLVINGYNISCSSKGKCEVSKDTKKYMYFASSTPCDGYVSELSEEFPTTKAYIKYEYKENATILDNPEACIYYNNKELCVKKGEYDTSKNKILNYFNYDEDKWHNSGTNRKTSPDNSTECYFSDYETSCNNSSVSVTVQTNGDVSTVDRQYKETTFTCYVEAITECYSNAD